MSVTQNHAFVNDNGEADVAKITKELNATWAERKIYAKRVSAKLAAVGETKRAAAVGSCAQNIITTVCPSCGHIHSQAAFLCRDRVCPICQWRLARQRFAEMCEVLSVIARQEQHTKVTMLTLTVRNCAPEELRATCEKMSKAWFNLYRTTLFNGVVGTARSLEITYNRNKKTLHPHYHILLLWDKGVTPKTGFVEKVAQKWGKLLKVDYKTIIDHREAYIKNKIAQDDEQPPLFPHENMRAVIEAFKYAFKTDIINELPKDIYKIFLNEIKGLRFVSYTGIFKTIRSALGFNDSDTPEDKDIDLLNACSACGEKCQKLLFTWATGEYVRGWSK